MAEHEALQIGHTFAGRYRVEKFLAKGGFGAVYIAEQIETELKVALKVLWPHVLYSTDAVEKFRLEARVAGRVGSEHIVKVFDAGFDAVSGMPFLVMELLKGSELDKIVQTEGPLPFRRVVDYFRQIAAGLDKAHGYVTREGVATPIVHRDLKPENLFLAEREAGEPMIKILDFGIAKVLSESTQVSQEVKGTPLYMAFEQVAAGRITPQTDIWPLGLIAFYLLTGKAYWKAANHGEATITQLFGEVLSLPIEIASERARLVGSTVALPAAFDAWFARCVEREPARRFASAGECARALAAALGDTATQVSPPFVVTPDSGAGAVPGRTLGNTTASPLISEAPPALTTPRKSGALKWVVAGVLVLGAAGALTLKQLSGAGPVASQAEPELPAPSVAAKSAAAEPAPGITALAPTPSGSATPAPSAAAAPSGAPPNQLAARSKTPSPARDAIGNASEKPSAPTATPKAAAPATAPKPADVYGDR